MFFSSSPVWQTSGLTLIRLTLAGFLIYHGWEIFNEVKINEYLAWDTFTQSNGKLLVYAGKAAELLAGILYPVADDFLAASLLAIGTMCYIAFVLGNGIVWNNDQHPFLFALLALVFFFTGAGRISVDQYLFSKKSSYH